MEKSSYSFVFSYSHLLLMLFALGIELQNIQRADLLKKSPAFGKEAARD